MRWALVLLVAAMFAGCASDKSEVSDEPLQEAHVTKTLGSIVGVVVDETITPVAGAVVTLGTQDYTIETDGAFVFNDVEPGRYIVTAVAEEHLPAQTEVLVVEGAIAEAKIIMQTDRRQDPFHATVPFQGFMNLHAGPASSVLVALAPEQSACTCTLEFTIEPGALTYVLEAYGDPSIAANPVGGDVYWELLAQDHPDTEDDETFGATGEGAYPIHETIPATAFSPIVTDFTARLTGGNWVHAQESYELYLTTFYYGIAPTDFSAVA